MLIGLIIVGALIIVGTTAGVLGGKVGKREMEKRKPKPKMLACPFCKNVIEKDWVSCPYCGVRSKDDTQIY